MSASVQPSVEVQRDTENVLDRIPEDKRALLFQVIDQRNHLTSEIVENTISALLRSTTTRVNTLSADVFNHSEVIRIQFLIPGFQLRLDYNLELIQAGLIMASAISLPEKKALSTLAIFAANLPVMSNVDHALSPHGPDFVSKREMIDGLKEELDNMTETALQSMQSTQTVQEAST